MKTEVLQSIADMLRNDITDEQFDIGHWFQHCGSVGCAIGHAVHRNLIPGLKLDYVPFIAIDGTIEKASFLTPVMEGATIEPQRAGAGLGTFAAFHAASAALDLTLSDTVELFDSDSYLPEDFENAGFDEEDEFVVTREMAADRIEAFIAGKWPR